MPRSAIIRLASFLPKGSPHRRQLLKLARMNPTLNPTTPEEVEEVEQFAETEDPEHGLMVHVADPNIPDPDETVRVVPKGEFYPKGPNYLVRRPALMLDREITQNRRQVMARQKSAKKLRKIRSLRELYQKAQQDPGYMHLLKISAENLGHIGPKNFDAWVRTLENNADHTGGVGIVDEVNFVLDIAQDDLDAGRVKSAAANLSVLDRYPNLKKRMGRDDDPYIDVMTSLQGFGKYAKRGKEEDYLEAVAIYFVLTQNFDDMAFSKVARAVKGVRKALGGSILAAYEKGGSFGPHDDLLDAIIASGLAFYHGKPARKSAGAVKALLYDVQEMAEEISGRRVDDEDFMDWAFSGAVDKFLRAKDLEGAARAYLSAHRMASAKRVAAHFAKDL